MAIGLFKMQYIIIFLVLIIEHISCSSNDSTIELDYSGGSFPTKYLFIEGSDVSASDIDYYIDCLKLVVNYFNDEPNDTNVNTALGIYLAKSILKRTLLDYEAKLQTEQIKGIRQFLNTGDNILSHYIYENKPYGWKDLEYRVSILFKSDASLTYSISKFNRNRLTKWILSNENNVNKYLEDMDAATLPKDEFGKLALNMDEYHINIKVSDVCVARLAYTNDQLDITQMQKCSNDKYCEKNVYANPSIGYSLSHRLLNVFMRVAFKRCYLRSENEDIQLMDQLCANMYREAVYIARRGFFSRDLFLEHITLCGMLGYEEFFRRNWFKKATSWLNKEGCMPEDRNYMLNYSKHYLRTNGTAKEKRKLREYSCKYMSRDCDEHASALLMPILGHAIRHAVTYLKDLF